MSWMNLGIAAAGMLMGQQKNQRARQIEDADRKLAAETSRYSWLTGMQPGQIRTAGSAVGDTVSGGLAGLATAQSFGKFGTPDKKSGWDQLGADQDILADDALANSMAGKYKYFGPKG